MPQPTDFSEDLSPPSDGEVPEDKNEPVTAKVTVHHHSQPQNTLKNSNGINENHWLNWFVSVTMQVERKM